MFAQAFGLAIVIAVLVFSPLPWLAAIVLGLLLATWCALNVAYARKLRVPRAPARASGDLLVAIQIAIVIVCPVIALVVRLAVGRPLWTKPEVTVGVAAVAVFLWAAYASCLIDWYYVRPRRDGVITAPPCRTSGDAHWTTVTRMWYLHRCLVVVIGAIATVVATVAFGLAALGGDLGGDTAKFGSLLVAGAGAALALTRVFYGGLASVGDVLTSCCFGAPDIAIGERLVGPEPVVGGYVQEIGLEGMTVVLIDGNGIPVRNRDVRSRTKRHVLAYVLDKPEIQGIPFSPCTFVCQRANNDCHWVPEAVPAPRWFVLGP